MDCRQGRRQGHSGGAARTRGGGGEGGRGPTPTTIAGKSWFPPPLPLTLPRAMGGPTQPRPHPPGPRTHARLFHTAQTGMCGQGGGAGQGHWGGGAGGAVRCLAPTTFLRASQSVCLRVGSACVRVRFPQPWRPLPSSITTAHHFPNHGRVPPPTPPPLPHTPSPHHGFDEIM